MILANLPSAHCDSLLNFLSATSLYRGQGADAGYDSDMSLEAYDLSEGPKTDGASLSVSQSAVKPLLLCDAQPGYPKCGRTLDKSPTYRNFIEEVPPCVGGPRLVPRQYSEACSWANSAFWACSPDPAVHRCKQSVKATSASL